MWRFMGRAAELYFSECNPEFRFRDRLGGAWLIMKHDCQADVSCFMEYSNAVFIILSSWHDAASCAYLTHALICRNPGCEDSIPVSK